MRRAAPPRRSPSRSASPAPPAGAAPADARAADRAAAWLAANVGRARPAGSRPTPIVAMRAAGRSRRRRCGRGCAPLGARRAGLRPHRRAAPARWRWRPSPPAPTRAASAGVDYVAPGHARATRPGRYGATAYDQALSMLALRAAARPVPRGGGPGHAGRRAAPAAGASTSRRGGRDSVDATAVVIEALARRRRAAAPTPALRGRGRVDARPAQPRGRPRLGRGRRADGGQLDRRRDPGAARPGPHAPAGDARGAARAAGARRRRRASPAAAPGSRLLATNDAPVALRREVSAGAVTTSPRPGH